MSLCAYEIALIAGGFTIVGAILGAWIAYRTALKTLRITEFNKAAAIFRAKFSCVQREMNNVSIPEHGLAATIVYDLIKNALPKHEIAFIRFVPYLRIIQPTQKAVR